MGDGARSARCDRFVEEFAEEIQKAQGDSDGSYVGIDDTTLTVRFCLETRTRSYTSDWTVFDPDWSDEDTLSYLLMSMLLEEGTSGYEEKVKGLVDRLKAKDLVEPDFTVPETA